MCRAVLIGHLVSSSRFVLRILPRRCVDAAASQDAVRNVVTQLSGKPVNEIQKVGRNLDAKPASSGPFSGFRVAGNAHKSQFFAPGAKADVSISY